MRIKRKLKLWAFPLMFLFFQKFPQCKDLLHKFFFFRERGSVTYGTFSTHKGYHSTHSYNFNTLVIFDI